MLTKKKMIYVILIVYPRQSFSFFNVKVTICTTIWYSISWTVLITKLYLNTTSDLPTNLPWWELSDMLLSSFENRPTMQQVQWPSGVWVKTQGKLHKATDLCLASGLSSNRGFRRLMRRNCTKKDLVLSQFSLWGYKPFLQLHKTSLCEYYVHMKII